MRQVLIPVLAGVTVAASLQAPAAAHHADPPLNPVTALTAATFADPPQNDMPWARWNFPPATATIAGLEADLQDAYDHNIGGVEIGQGGVPTTEQLTAIYQKADKLGIKVSLKAANGLPGATYSATDDLARRTLAVSPQVVDGGATLSGTVPGSATGTIVAVLAYRCAAATCPAAGPIAVDRSSVRDLTGTLTGTNTDGYQDGSTAGMLTWTAPAGNQWTVLTFRAVPFGAQPETLTRAGTKQVTDAYDAYFAGGLGTLVRRNGGDFFVDSHASDPWGAPEELWSSTMRSDFRKRAGYDLVPGLAALVSPTMAGAGLGGVPAGAISYEFSDGSADRIRSDFNRVRSDLYTENRIVPFQGWAHTYNMKLRLQQEDGPVTSIGDQLQTSSVLDRSEYESLTGSDQTDLYRPMASATHLTGNSWYSTECCAVLNGSYLETYQDAVVRMNHEFAGGVNRIVYHIRPYVDTPATTWPGLGFSATSKVSFSNAWNRTEPYWVDAAAMNDYFARNHQVLTQGDAKVDVAVYLRNYSSPAAFSTTDPNNRHWQDLSLQRAGYSWDYLDENLFELPNATVSHGRLAADGPAYKALIFDQFLYPTTNTARGTLTVEAATDILRYARSGLPVVFVGTPTGTGQMPASSDATLSKLLGQIFARRNVVRVASEAAVPSALAELGIHPATEPAAPATLQSVRRADRGTDFYYLYNQGVDAWPGSTASYGKNPSNLYEEPAACATTTVANPCMATGGALDTTVTLEGDGAPYVLDAFTGEITPIAQYTRKGGTVTIRVRLARDASTIIALSTDSHRFGASGPHVVSTTADSAIRDGRDLVVRASEAGTYTTTLDNGRRVVTRIPSVPASVDLTGADWSLTAKDWQPANPYGTTGEAGTATVKKQVGVALHGLKAWPDIPELASASGIGYYTTTVTLPASWSRADGATLDLGRVTDTFTLTVNGHAVAVDQIGASADLGPYLHAGANTIAVRVATTLNNRLAALDAAVRNRGVIQNYGLVGPVVLSPYRQEVVATTH
ncbi:glycosyl hydrolase [Paractinoplanes globisporus]|uniref:Glycosyl hydrolase n=1 Tax=Paractinoplanes globisporus TaxID=113565 RepID=A0ABW6W7B5_9ACTN|nr:glycosyl hydrolase [Actinoplanes globisporus]